MKTNSYILVLNCGSSSVKATVFNTDSWEPVFDTYLENVKNHNRSLKKLFKTIQSEHPELIQNTKKVGHRVVHGGEKFSKPTKVNKKVLTQLEALIPLAPLHNPANIAGIKACQKLLPGVTNYAVFDTAYYATLPEKAYLYALPHKLYREHNIRRYGFHGTSHEYVVNETLKHLGPVRKEGGSNTPRRVVSCHLGNGASITASINGKAIDTSMGFTPLEGIPMGTRCGDIDPAIIFFLEKQMGGKFSLKTIQKVQHILEKESGLKGVSEISNDMRDIRDAYFVRDKSGKLKNPKKLNKHEKNSRLQAKRALDLYCYRIAKYIGAYTTSMGGVDAIIFTATIGEKADYVRKWVCEYLEYLGLKLDSRKNKRTINPKSLTALHDKKSKVKVFTIPTNEALQIARSI